MLEAALRVLGGLAAPPRCGACGRPCPSAERLCAGCGAALEALPGLVEPGPPGVDLACAVGPYDGVVRDLVVGLKFGRRLTLAAAAAAAIEGACSAEELRGQVVPVPAAPLRWRWRGFDPAEEIALALAASTGLELNPCLRREQGPRQMGRPRATRLANAPQIHLAGPPATRALLVDDVHTTGATLGACAEALRLGGCREVVALTLARA